MNIVITGGAGFIGSNAADYFLTRGHDIAIFDNLSRPGADMNVSWLRERHGSAFELIVGDIRDYESLSQSIAGTDAVIHLAGQVAVTTSVQNPRDDFENNALGTLNVLEAVRLKAPKATVLYASSNKVYGAMTDIAIAEHPTRYNYADYPHGIPETYPLDFHSPYGCSKGAGDQYSIDYARIYGLNTVVLRQSCIYGPRQFGVEDQGWVAHFVIAAVLGQPITIYGDGKQVRDVLHVQDLLEVYETCLGRGSALAGSVFNIGGGPDNTLSVWAEFGPLLEELVERPLVIRTGDWRPGDQRVFVSDIRRAQSILGWTPSIQPAAGIRDLVAWVRSDPDRFRQ